MLDLTFGEQVKIILSRKGMTIKELAEIIEERTGKKMSRQNLTQRLGRDNFQEQDMRMIADILECPFQLSILADSEAVERASNIGDVPPTEKELSKLAKAKARREKKAKEAERLADAMEQVPTEIEGEAAEKELTIGDYIDIHEELERQETGKLPKIPGEPEVNEPELAKPETAGSETVEPETTESEIMESESIAVEEEPEAAEDTGLEAGTEEVQEAHHSYRDEPSITEYMKKVSEAEKQQETSAEETSDLNDVFREMEEMEKESRQSHTYNKIQEEHRQEEKKIGGWRAIFQRRTKKERQEEKREEEKIEQEITGRLAEPEADPIDYEETVVNEEPELEEEAPAVEETVEEVFETEEILEDDEEAEDLSRGDVNPYTGHEYESNSVRMHPKRIGYVQVYDRKDHAWTDMTEWAFLGYQERKKALLGKDYEPPIYLD